MSDLLLIFIHRRLFYFQNSAFVVLLEDGIFNENFSTRTNHRFNIELVSVLLKKYNKE